MITKKDIRFEFKLQDFWVGVFWKTTNCKTDNGEVPFCTDVWICLIPCLPLHLTFWRRVAIPI